MPYVLSLMSFHLLQMQNCNDDDPLINCLEGALSSNYDHLEESSEELDDSLEYSPPSPYYIPSESGEDDDED
ncbi:hypothetical protein AVEN_167257-1 [Araneus ventricosus]|uniref:Uncharacterized protein n=1 Tax=Araneus ventricosus TaxID=182803 RepID=A0A4Y2HG28_ARAVE|nr:hypothetical protein AVEN_167257-1 [Araneus ventricosus]